MLRLIICGCCARTAKLNHRRRVLHGLRIALLAVLLMECSGGAVAQDSFFDGAIDLANLNGQNGFAISGNHAQGRAGWSVSGAGDVNGDGLDDLLIGAPFVSRDGSNEVGESYVVFGSSTGFAASFELSALDGANGFAILTKVAGSNIGATVSAAGDVNGDGIADMIIGGESTYVLFGSTSAFAAVVDVDSLGSDRGFAISAPDGVSSVSGAGDVNGDGVDDLVVGTYGNLGDMRGNSYVVFGSDTGLPNSLDLGSLNGGNGFAIHGVSQGDRAGTSVSGAGDINNDGLADVVIGAPYAFRDARGQAGESYVVFGSDAGFAATFELSALDGSNGFVLQATEHSDIDGPRSGRAGYSVSGAGDVNADGIDDLLIGAPEWETSSSPLGTGATYVVFGTTSGFDAALDLETLDGGNGFVIHGSCGFFDCFTKDGAGRSVSGAGDVNADGIADILIAAPGEPGDTLGAAYVVFGSSAGFLASVFVSSNDGQINGPGALDGSNGFALNFDGALTLNFEAAVSDAGDVNGDGIDDFIVGAPGAFVGADFDVGQAFVVFGARPNVIPEPATITLTGLVLLFGALLAPGSAGRFVGRGCHE